MNYTVKTGDTLWSLALKHLGNGEYWKQIITDSAAQNLPNRTGTGRPALSVSNPTIYTGEHLIIDRTTPGDDPVPPKPDIDPPNNTSTPTIEFFGIQAGTDRTLFATWKWSKTHTENYSVEWYYDTGDGVWFVGDKSTTDDKQSLYSAPSNANTVRFKVKANSETYTVNKEETTYWTSGWSTYKKHSFTRMPETPSAPTVVIEDTTLTASFENIRPEAYTTSMTFQIVRDDSSVYKTGSAVVEFESVSFSTTVGVGHTYKVRAKAHHDNTPGEWGPYSSNVGTIPAAPSKISKCEAFEDQERSVILEWTVSPTADSYEIQYTKKKSLFDISDDVSSVTVEGTTRVISGIDPNERYFFRVRATNSQGVSGWTKIVSTVVGEKPSPPTTWSSTNAVTVGTSINLYWIHNSSAGSKPKKSALRYTNRNGNYVTVEVAPPSGDDNYTNAKTISTSGWPTMPFKWSVRTTSLSRAVIPADGESYSDDWSDPSVERIINISTRPSLTVSLHWNEGSSAVSGNNPPHFPFEIWLTPENDSGQSLISCHTKITALESYKTLDASGVEKTVQKNDVVYSKFEENPPIPYGTTPHIALQMTAANVDLQNNISYKITSTFTYDSGLNATDTMTFAPQWDSSLNYEPNATLSYKKDTVSMQIRPYCADNSGQLISNVRLSVYRKNYDGSFSEIAKNVANSKSKYFKDPHPALDYARYRIIAESTLTGEMSYFDAPAYPIHETAAIIQWDETWSSFDIPDSGSDTVPQNSLEDPPWSGSLIRLPYNIDISSSYSPDVSLVNYIGRENPVSYYGTQHGEGQNWSVEIPKTDVDTLYAIRRLSVYMGNCYIREPSGTGYWANVTVSYSRNHLELTIPITFSIKRVEGGV